MTSWRKHKHISGVIKKKLVLILLLFCSTTTIRDEISSAGLKSLTLINLTHTVRIASHPLSQETIRLKTRPHENHIIELLMIQTHGQANYNKNLSQIIAIGTKILFLLHNTKIVDLQEILYTSTKNIPKIFKNQG